MKFDGISFDQLDTLDANAIRFGLSIASIIVMILLRSISRKRLKRLSVINAYEPHRLFLIRKTIAVVFWLILITLFLLIWGVNMENIWIYFGGFLSVIAIGFFAVWSILSNIIAGMLIFILNPFKVGSKVKLYDPEAEATVLNINLMFTELEDEEGVFNVPNNIFFQKVIKVVKTNPKRKKTTE